MEYLNKEKLISLLGEADDKWFREHGTKPDYRRHLEFTADHIAKNYHRKRRNNGRKNSSGAANRERTDSRTGKKTEENKNMFDMPSSGGRRRAKV